MGVTHSRRYECNELASTFILRRINPCRKGLVDFVVIVSRKALAAGVSPVIFRHTPAASTVRLTRSAERGGEADFS
jgi:hypothetical protein